MTDGHTAIRAMVRRWPKEWQYEWLERASIMEFDGEMTRSNAEYEAYWDVKKQI